MTNSLRAQTEQRDSTNVSRANEAAVLTTFSIFEYIHKHLRNISEHRNPCNGSRQSNPTNWVSYVGSVEILFFRYILVCNVQSLKSANTPYKF